MARNIPFQITNKDGNYATSGYATTAYPLVFGVRGSTLINQGDVSIRRVLWDFGDGTTADTLTAEHAFVNPGRYRVTLFAHNSAGELVQGNTTSVNIYSLLGNTAAIAFTSAATVNAGEVVTLSAVGFRHANIDTDVHTFKFELAPVSGLDGYTTEPSFVTPYYGLESEIITADAIPVYATITSGNIAYSTISSANSIYAGTSSQCINKFVSFIAGSRAKVAVKLDTFDIERSLSGGDVSVVSNALNIHSPSYNLPEVTTAAAPVSGNISLNGSDNNIFTLPNIIYTDVKYPVVFKLWNTDGGILDSSINAVLSASTISASVPEVIISIDSINGVIEGSLSALDSAITSAYIYWTVPALSATLSVAFNIVSSSKTISPILRNEHFDPIDLFKGQIKVERMLENNILLDTFIGTIIGNEQSNTNAIGKRVYERIANFSPNHSDVDTCNINALQSMMQMTDTHDAIKFNGAPADLTRILDLASIKYSVIHGERTMFNEDFGKRNDGFSVEDGRNIGAEVTINTTLTTNTDSKLVVYDKFNQRYFVVSLHIHPAVLNTSTGFAISQYDARWGWGLALPNNYTADDITKFYKFFKYVDAYENVQISGIVPWLLNTEGVLTEDTSLIEWKQDKGVIDNLISEQLLRGIRILPAI